MDKANILDDKALNDLKDKAKKIRCHIIQMIKNAGIGHIGGSLSVTDILTALYFHILNIDPANPGWPDRDRLILSKGHGATALYSTLAERGFISPDILSSFAKLSSSLQVHPDRTKVSGVEASTGALGQGLSIGAGIAYAAKLDDKDYHTYIVLGDGETQEGQVWEAAMFCSHYRLDNLTAILDHNNIQLMGNVPDIMDIHPVKEKWISFGWKTLEIDGHDFSQIISAVSIANKTKGTPTLIIANTTKGKGVSLMQNSCTWHGKVPTDEQCRNAICEILNS